MNTRATFGWLFFALLRSRVFLYFTTYMRAR